MAPVERTTFARLAGLYRTISQCRKTALGQVKPGGISELSTQPPGNVRLPTLRLPIPADSTTSRREYDRGFGDPTVTDNDHLIEYKERVRSGQEALSNGASRIPLLLDYYVTFAT
jgi:hypothetical protein